MTERPISGLLADLIHYAKRVQGIYVRCGSAEALAGDDIAQDAILWNLVAIGEVGIRLGHDFHAKYPDIPWAAIIGQRNIIAHGYDVIVWDRLFPEIESDIPSLI